MQWAYEGKKLDCAVKHLAWRPPWVKAADFESPDPAAPFVRPEHMVEDTVGLGRIPAIWFTLNCKYNAAYDIHRLNCASKFANAAVASLRDEHSHVRFDFTRDAPDVVTYMVALRTELNMRVVMPAIVPHTEKQPYLAMARFESSEGHHPHFHGFGVGSGNPRLQRVRADADDGGEGDEAPLSDMDEEQGSEDMPSGEEAEEGGAESVKAVPPVEGAAVENTANAVSQDAGTEAARAGRGGRGGRRKSQGRRQLALQPTMPRLPDTLHPRNAGVQSQSAMEEEFFQYFGELVSEWNPCFSTDGRARYTWDEEIGAHDVEVCLPCGEEVRLPRGDADIGASWQRPTFDVRSP